MVLRRKFPVSTIGLTANQTTRSTTAGLDDVGPNAASEYEPKISNYDCDNLAISSLVLKNENKTPQPRWFPTKEQKQILLNAYGNHKFPTAEQVMQLVNILNIYERKTDEIKVRDWFKNRRKRERQKEKKEKEGRHWSMGSSSARMINENSEVKNNSDEKINNDG
ncbi:WUSCHEL-related homeobox 1-like [Macadamia integrifolia]|uniref:WUSCHEL-related homeobox 1-like n=1 Tax=Macadamia integrifolia TaxID=60698 RepID=UPI001C4EB1BD|nr:WUSCHEL-related homeobox 1-like [Macadamia integrifolia]